MGSADMLQHVKISSVEKEKPGLGMDFETLELLHSVQVQKHSRFFICSRMAAAMANNPPPPPPPRVAAAPGAAPPQPPAAHQQPPPAAAADMLPPPQAAQWHDGFLNRMGELLQASLILAPQTYL